MLRGLTVVVTGGSGDIGRACVGRSLCEGAAFVVSVDRRPLDMDQLSTEVQEHTQSRGAHDAWQHAVREEMEFMQQGGTGEDKGEEGQEEAQRQREGEHQEQRSSPPHKRAKRPSAAGHAQQDMELQAIRCLIHRRCQSVCADLRSEDGLRARLREALQALHTRERDQSAGDRNPKNHSASSRPQSTSSNQGSQPRQQHHPGPARGDCTRLCIHALITCAGGAVNRTEREPIDNLPTTTSFADNAALNTATTVAAIRAAMPYLLCAGSSTRGDGTAGAGTVGSEQPAAVEASDMSPSATGNDDNDDVHDRNNNEEHGAVDLRALAPPQPPQFPSSCVDVMAGSVVMVSSVNAVTGIGQVAYSAAKAALHPIAADLAVRFGRYGLRANAVALGTVATMGAWKERHERDPEVFRKIGRRIPRGRVASAWEAAASAVVLAGPAGALITGQCIVADGGWSLACGTSVVRYREQEGEVGGSGEGARPWYEM